MGQWQRTARQEKQQLAYRNLRRSAVPRGSRRGTGVLAAAKEVAAARQHDQAEYQEDHLVAGQQRWGAAGCRSRHVCLFQRPSAGSRVYCGLLAGAAWPSVLRCADFRWPLPSPTWEPLKKWSAEGHPNATPISLCTAEITSDDNVSVYSPREWGQGSAAAAYLVLCPCRRP